MKNKNQKVTVIDVARHAGVSKSTVSLVLTQSDKVSEKAKIKVAQAIDALGYVYNREAASLRSRRSNLIAIVINDLTNPYSAQLAVGLEQNIRQMGMFSMLVNSGEDVETQQQLVKNLKEYNVAAFIICPAPNTSATWLNNLVAQGFPVITIMREVSGANVPSVLPDNVKGSQLATEHLIKQGYKTLAFIGGDETISDYHQRLQGFKQAIEQANITNKEVDKEPLCIQSPTNRHGGRQAMQQALLTNKNIDAVVCFNDVIAYGAIEQMRASNKLPGKDIAIVGFDDLQDSRLMSPSLSTVHIDANQIGIAVCQILKSIKHSDQNKILIDVELMLRESG